MIWTLVQIALGGAAGALLRFATQSGVARLFGTGFPLGTLVANALGSFVLGAVFIWLTQKGMMRFAPLLMVGLLGAYTTFSTFSLDAWALWERGQVGLAAGYVALSVTLALAGLWLGILAGRGLWG